MKNSDVFFPYKIPPHWTQKRVKYFTSFTLSSIGRNYEDGDVDVDICHYPQVYKNEFITRSTELEKGRCSKQEFKSFSVQKGDILITKDSESPDDIGIPSLVTEDLENTVCGYHLGIYRVTSDVLPTYLFRFLQSEYVKHYFEINSNGVTRFGLGKPSLQNLEVPIPPLEEQREIIEKIQDRCLGLDRMLELHRLQIERLQEFRHSFISSVVMGEK